MEKYVLEAFFLMGDVDGGLRRMKRRYRAMVESDITTLWEHWYRAAGSYNHGWAGGPLTLLSRYVLGVAPLEPGYELYQVMPQMGHLRSIHAVVPSVKGTIAVQLERSDSSFVLSLNSPPGTMALVGIPRYHDSHWQRITANGHPVWQNTARCAQFDGVKFRELTPNHITFLLEPGQWEFEASA